MSSAAGTAQSIEPSSALASVEPAFVSYAYFLRFRFEPNHYALVGREAIDGKPVLRIEYYPSELFREGRTRPNRRVRDRDEDIEDKMNKVSLVTLWVDREAHQILQYAFDDIDMDFLPGRTSRGSTTSRRRCGWDSPSRACGCQGTSRCAFA